MNVHVERLRRWLAFLCKLCEGYAECGDEVPVELDEIITSLTTALGTIMVQQKIEEQVKQALNSLNSPPAHRPITFSDN